MALKRKLTKDEFEKLGDAQKELYKEKDGSYLLDLDGEDLEGKVRSLKDSLDKAYKERDEAKKAAEAFKDVDPEKYRQLLAEAESKETDDLKSKGKIDEILEKQAAKIADLNKTWQQKLDAAHAELNKFKVDLKLRESAEKAGIIPELLDDVVDLHRSRVKFSDKGDIQILDKDGTPLDVSPENYFKEVLKEQRPHYYPSTGAGGSGAPPNGGAGGGAVKTVKREDVLKMPPAQARAVATDVQAGKTQLVD